MTAGAESSWVDIIMYLGSGILCNGEHRMSLYTNDQPSACVPEILCDLYFYMATRSGELSEDSGPLNVEQIVQRAQNFDYNPLIPLRYWLRTATTLLKEAYNIFLLVAQDTDLSK